MFYGSDTHAKAAAALFSLIASCRLHLLDPFAYLEEVMRVLPCWPDDRFLELAPKHWRATRAKLDMLSRDRRQAALPFSLCRAMATYFELGGEHRQV